ncbi:hypothetical protein NQ314_007173 [Rhamnusium bicolor]|uniref:DUF4365 domain-containing protein n=1 Tax=Rhamnusium bicolor TaxID=1586634 RepID=A0AAV8YTI5_9CUCU|nr:hypothetical protein NQ314_007173 [Rhamnusium bicolor]
MCNCWFFCCPCCCDDVFESEYSLTTVSSPHRSSRIPYACEKTYLSNEEIKFERRQFSKKKGSAGIEGGLFQINLLTMFLIIGLKQQYCRWLLSTENEEAEKFDDIVFETGFSDILVQAKYRLNKNKKITIEDLFSTNSKNDDFSLPKYFFSFEVVKKKFTVEYIVICTNADIKLDEQMRAFVNTKRLENDMMHLEGMDYTFYTFNDCIISELEKNVRKYYADNLQCKNIDENIISTENIKDFFGPFAIVF